MTDDGTVGGGDSRLEELARREISTVERLRALRGKGPRGLLGSLLPVKSLPASEEDMFRRREESGIFAESAKVHAAYVDLAGPPISNLEALKRAIYLGWAQDSEHECFSGICRLEETMIRRGHDLLADANEAGRIDEEFAAMLQHYWGVADWLFYTRPAYRRLAFLASLPEPPRNVRGLRARLSALAWDAMKKDPRYATFSLEDLETRGLMGEYWIGVLWLRQGQ